ncbi:MAG: bifunctional homocysteine S-methyltransferase/methylenetetrahydrofolate reductase [Chloroflexi bacterium]|nr:bifunctional homocysteine S-methyltransferase/methylenetetrahydrofolate reductase [Chloroflexota bacterium]MCI0580243.1 bifunctional homocysteine S-methyltransferase/methylenetetrahydrofolate reductase [Chloroflexota bacterium]MCI0646896.1 bifunctional homocysteine S-methyltransferase/methylenetetrahydrofolate reductase [Chloroflexota bacterium]MCI0729099.1 bifunctional homocysteine S-methyltransferase/methylenetetrahydrofolate reductase [Chloroflexota bacterium]
MNRDDFRERLKRGPLLLDGAMGTMLHGRGIPISDCFDAINRENPALVAEVHRGYIEAGVDVIETNSFGANRYKLAQHGLEGEVAGLNQAAVAVARRVIAGSFKPVLLAGSVGPLGVRLAPLGRVKASQAEEAFAEQIGALVSPPAGVDLIILETISDLKEMAVAVKAARAVAPNIPIIANMTFTRDDRTLLGDNPVVVAEHLAGLDVDVIGVNCSSGPVQVLRLLATFHQVVGDRPLAAVPNAGWPQQIEGGRLMYPATPAYFSEYTRAFLEAGARIVGGCCGTTARHIAAMHQALNTPGENVHPLPVVQLIRRGERLAAAPTQQTELAETLAEKRFMVTVEMSPPRGTSAQRLLAGAQMLKEAGANFINVADSPLARMRMSAWAAAHLIQKEIGLETVLHFPTRGRNLLRVQGDLLAAYALGIHNLFVVMGDPTQIGDYPEAMDNYDIVPTGLIQLIKQRLNSGVDQHGQTIDEPTGFVVGCAVNLEPEDLAAELKLMHKKIKNGADFALSQPVFNPPVARTFIKAYKAEYGEPLIPIVAGVQPLYNSGNAEFLHNEVPGISIPDVYRERMRAAADPQREGVIIAQEMLAELRPVVQGVYMIPVFGRYDLVADVLDALPGV